MEQRNQARLLGGSECRRRQLEILSLGLPRFGELKVPLQHESRLHATVSDGETSSEAANGQAVAHPKERGAEEKATPLGNLQEAPR